jgi:hypothetical protein
VETKADGDISPTNMGKAEAAEKYFARVNDLLAKRRRKRRYRFHFLSPQDYEKFLRRFATENSTRSDRRSMPAWWLEGMPDHGGDDSLDPHGEFQKGLRAPSGGWYQGTADRVAAQASAAEACLSAPAALVASYSRRAADRVAKTFDRPGQTPALSAQIEPHQAQSSGMIATAAGMKWLC